jgi:hypothetical protein
MRANLHFVRLPDVDVSKAISTHAATQPLVTAVQVVLDWRQNLVRNGQTDIKIENYWH